MMIRKRKTPLLYHLQDQKNEEELLAKYGRVNRKGSDINEFDFYVRPVFHGNPKDDIVPQEDIDNAEIYLVQPNPRKLTGTGEEKMVMLDRKEGHFIVDTLKDGRCQQRTITMCLQDLFIKSISRKVALDLEIKIQTKLGSNYWRKLDMYLPFPPTFKNKRTFFHPIHGALVKGVKQRLETWEKNGILEIPFNYKRGKAMDIKVLWDSDKHWRDVNRKSDDDMVISVWKKREPEFEDDHRYRITFSVSFLVRPYE